MEPGELIPEPSNDQMCIACERSDKPLRVCASENCSFLTCDDCSHVCPGCSKGPICHYRYICSCGITYCYNKHSYFMRVCVHSHEKGEGQCRAKTCPICDPNRLTIDRCNVCGSWKCVDKDTVHDCDFTWHQNKFMKKKNETPNWKRKFEKVLIEHKPQYMLFYLKIVVLANC